MRGMYVCVCTCGARVCVCVRVYVYCFGCFALVVEIGRLNHSTIHLGLYTCAWMYINLLFVSSRSNTKKTPVQNNSNSRNINDNYEPFFPACPIFDAANSAGSKNGCRLLRFFRRCKCICTPYLPPHPPTHPPQKS